MKYIITFVVANDRYIRRAKKLLHDTKNERIGDFYKLFTDEYFKNDKDFWNKHGKFIGKKQHWEWTNNIV